MIGGLLMTPSVQQTPSIQPDPVVSKLLPAPATSRREFPRADLLALYTEIYDNDTSRQARRIDVTVRLVGEDGTEVLGSRDELANGGPTEKPWEIYGYAKQIPLKTLSPGRYVLRVEAAVRGRDRAPATRVAHHGASVVIVHRPSSIVHRNDDRRWTLRVKAVDRSSAVDAARLRPDAMGAQSDRLRCFDVCLQIIEKHDGLWRGDLSAFECEPEDRRIWLAQTHLMR